MDKKKVAVRIDKRIIDGACSVFKELGLTLEQGVNIYLYQVFYTQSVPFPVRLPTDERERARVKLYFELQKGLAQLETAEPLSGEEVFSKLRAKYSRQANNDGDG